MGRTSGGMEDHTGAIPAIPGPSDPRNGDVPVGGSGVNGRVVKGAVPTMCADTPFPFGFPRFFLFHSPMDFSVSITRFSLNK